MNSTDLSSPDKQTIRSLFDQIAFRYDFLNSFLSLKLDDYWRAQACKSLLEGSEQTVLDLGIGTGKFLERFLKSKQFKFAAGVDFSLNMLKKAREVLPPAVHYASADFHYLPFQKGSFDLVISSFTLRSVKDMLHFVEEIYEILTPHGKAAFLCLTRPTNPFWKALYYPYLNFYLPLIGKLFTGNSEAYQFLSKSIQNFQEPGVTVGLLRRSGFQTIRITRLTMGIATLITAKK
jgi:demethylmenaquinone methyltransferase / 2-methoxy-6-polyprenyl-1,4-benzoquinol methylase